MHTLKYQPQLNQITGSITASLLMCQLEYWFDHTGGKPFYKFLEPCEDEHYHTGDSWTEEMGFTKCEFRTAFKHIGKVYKSKTEFMKSKNKFEGKCYASYYDRIKKLTYYIRNNDDTSQLLGSLQRELPYSLDYLSSEITTHKSSSLTSSSHTPYEHIIECFHACCPSLPAVTHLTSHCKNQLDKLCHRLEATGKDILTHLEKAFRLVESSDFLCGRIGHGKWKAAFGWIIRIDKFFAILEGAYAPFQPSSNPLTLASNHASMPSSSYTMTHNVTHTSTPCKPSPKLGSTFMCMYTHNFDIKELEAREAAHLEACYG